MTETMLDAVLTATREAVESLGNLAARHDIPDEEWVECMDRILAIAKEAAHAEP